MYIDYLFTNNKKQCYGCRACVEICPKNSITMLNDKETFLYPHVDKSKCINCNLCHEVCPANKTIYDLVNKTASKPIAIAAVHKSSDVVFNSSSGGAFTAILNSIYDKNTVIFGVCYNNRLQVIHDYVTTIEDSYKFRKSKYVQSNTNDSFSKVKQFLINNKKVVFSGTPCQIAALKTYLRNVDTNNLFCFRFLFLKHKNYVFVKN